MLHKLLLWSHRNRVSKKTQFNARRRRAARTLREINLGIECLESRSMLSTNPPVLTVFAESITFGEDLLLHIEDVATFEDEIVDGDLSGNYFYSIEVEETEILDSGIANIDFGAGPGGTLIGSFDAAGETGGLLFPDPGEYTVILKVTDPDLNESVPVSFTAIIEPTIQGIELRPPQVAGEDVFTVDEGSPYVISLVDNNDDITSINGWTVFWGDGTVSNESGATASHSYADDTAVDVQYYINAKVDTNLGVFWVGKGINFVEVDDVDPIVEIEGAAQVGVGEEYVISFPESSNFNPGNNEIVQWIISWESIAGPPADFGGAEIFSGTPTSVSHTYDSPGTFKVWVRATDDDSSVVACNFISVTVVADGVFLVDGVLSVLDTNAANDIVTVTQSGPSINVTSNGNTTVFDVLDVNEIEILLGSGHDVVVIGTNITADVMINGGDGNDFLAGGGGRSTLIGGNGNDILWGAAGDDVLLGGSGDDDLFGGGGNDALVGGVGNDIVTGGAGRDLLIGS